MKSTSTAVLSALLILAAIALTGCFQVRAPESIDVDLGNGRAHVGDHQPAPAGGADEALVKENQALRDQLAEVRGKLKAARAQAEQLEAKLEALRNAMEHAHDDDDDD